MIIIQKDLKWEPILQKDIGSKIKGFETIGIKLKGEVGNRHIIGMYRKSGKRENKSTWEKLLKNKKKEEIWIIGGDFNAHNTIWNCNNTDINGYNLNVSMEEKGLYIINDKTETWIGDVKRNPTNLDLFFASEEISDDMKYRQEEDTWGSDHFPVIVSIKFMNKSYKKEGRIR